MMQAAQPRHGYNLATCFGILHCLTTGRSFLGQCKMRPVVVIVANVLVHQPLQMAFVENDYVVEQIAAAVADPAFGNAVLPGTAEAGPLGLDTKALHRVDYFFIELCAAIKDQIAVDRVIRKRLARVAHSSHSLA